MGFFLKSDEVRVVELHTSEGVISVELYDSEATCVAEFFCRLAESGQLDGAKFGRMVPGFVLECALPPGRVYAELVEAKGSDALSHTGAGIVTCPVTDEGIVDGTTFFVTLGPQPKLDKTCVIFGRVYSGMRIIEKISKFRVANETFSLYSPVEVLRCVVRALPKAQRPPHSSRGRSGGVFHSRGRCATEGGVLGDLEGC